MIQGQISRISGPVVQARGMEGIKIRDLVEVGELGLIGEVIEIKGDAVSIQVYEDTDGLKVGEPVKSEGKPFLVQLGPGLLGSIYDGIQRPLEIIRERTGSFIQRGATGEPLPTAKQWHFVPAVRTGDTVSVGDLVGTVQEGPTIQHKIMVPEGISGRIASIDEGDYTITQPVAYLEGGESLSMVQTWPIRVPRRSAEKIATSVPLITGQRIFDTFFPVPKGGSAIIPGPFGSGKTVSQQALAKWSDADVVIYVGCGERGNEMTEVLTEFPHLEDPKSGKPLMERTVLIANTSNMPVAAREASVYTGITIAEYFRDMGYDVSLMADSTSRWAEAMREISSRLEEMPGEEGYPAYLAARLSEFYERAGLVETLNGASGSVSVIGAVSPPGGDFSEPVTQNTLRIVKVFWALDAKLSQRRHFPAINWLNSYSLYLEALHDYYDKEVSPEWNKIRSWAMEVLQKEAELQEIVQLVGSDALPESEQVTIEVARMIREIFLQQNAYDSVDTFCDMKKQYDMMKAIKAFADLAYAAQIAGVNPAQINTIKSKGELPQIKFIKDYKPELAKIEKQMDAEFNSLRSAA